MIEQNAKDQIFIRKLTEIILANLEDENFGIKELSRETALSQRNINKKLKSISGKTLSQFIRETRLQKAMEMLQNGNVTASEVTYKVGFSSPTYFNTCFHEYFGYSPGTVKKADFETPGELNPAQPSKEKFKKGNAGKIVIYIFALLLIFTVIVFLGYSFFSKTTKDYVGNPVAGTEKSIAVLPFNNQSDSTTNQYFIDGVMEEILTNLSRIHDLRVVSRTSVEQFRESKTSTSEIAKKLHVDYVVEGSGQKYGNSLSLRVQLIDASKDKHIWAESYEQEIGETKDIFKIQSRIAQSIAAELKATITPEEKKLIDKIPTTNLTAYDFYLKAEDEVMGQWPEFKPEAARRKEVLLHKALKCDSTYAQAYASLAGILWIKIDRDSSITDINIFNKYVDSMLVLTNTALSYDDKLAEAYNIRGVYYGYKGSAKKAGEEYDKAIRINPNYGRAYLSIALAYQNVDLVKTLENGQKAASLSHGSELLGILKILAYFYYQAGFPEKGNNILLEASKLDVDSAMYKGYLVYYKAIYLGDYKSAIGYYEKRYSRDSTDAGVLDNLGKFYLRLGHYQESLKYYKKYISLLKSRGQSKPPLESNIGYSYLRNGYRKEADFYFDKTIEGYTNPLFRARYVYREIEWDYNLASIYACRGDKGQAYENLKMFDQSQTVSLNWVTSIKNNPLFNSIKNEPEFQKIVRNIEARYQAEHERVRKWLEDQKML
jgi:TolB-like protein/AraC-like DNA-binding protein/Tfp pilus assembly protein PilF